MFMVSRWLGLLLLLLSLFGVQNQDDIIIQSSQFKFEEATIKEIHHAFSEGKLTAAQLVDFYLQQIDSLNPLLRAVVEINPDARGLAVKADLEWQTNRRNVGHLHGIPILLKDSIATKDKLNNTAGSYALLGSVPAEDAGVVKKLRKAGAIILGKASLSEWYSFRSFRMPAGWCARSGQGENPYVRGASPCASSSGSAISVAANLAAVSLGSETHGSILCPSDYNSVVGIKPTVGLTSRAGVVPISPRQDTIGPICRTVSDAVYVLDAIVGYDPKDSEATGQMERVIPAGGYRQFLKEDGLRGKTIGVLRTPVLQNYSSRADAAFEQHINTLRHRGAKVVDNLQIPNIETILSKDKNGELTALLAEFKISINEFLKDLTGSPVRSLADIISFNLNNPELEKMKEFGQSNFLASEMTSGIGEKERKAIETMDNLSRDGFEKVMQENKLDAMVTLGQVVLAGALSHRGHPGISVPAGYESNGMPFGICFGGLRGSEPKLIEIAYAFEQATKIRRPPSLSAF